MQTQHSPRSRHGLKYLVLSLALLVSMLAPHIEANPKAQAHFDKGLQLGLQRKWPQAEAEYRKAIALDPKNATYKSYLADALAAQGKFAQAQNTYKQSKPLKKSAPAKKTAPPTVAKKPTAAKPTASKPTSTRPATTRPRPPQNTTPTSPPRSPNSTVTRETETENESQMETEPANGTEDLDRDGQTFSPATPGDKTETVTNRDIIEATPEENNTGGRTNDEGNDHDDNSRIMQDAHYLKADEYFNEGKWAQAEVEYRAALKSYPQSSEGWHDLGDACFRQGKWKEAEQAYRSAIRLNPGEGYYHAQLAYALLKQNRRKEAIKSADEARRLNMEDHPVFDELE